MTFDWQIVVVAVAALWAAGVVLYRFARLFDGDAASGCHGGGCQSCPSNQTSPSSGLVQLDLPMKHAANRS